MMNKVTITISVGELLDKLSILHLKKRFISDKNKLDNILNEWEILAKEAEVFLADGEITKCYQSLLETNEKLWKVEDEIRILERHKQFDSEFISLARKVYLLNDERFSFKNKINLLTNSSIKEEKSYEEYR